MMGLELDVRVEPGGGFFGNLILAVNPLWLSLTQSEEQCSPMPLTF